ncbi:MAG: class I SAM-dependent methyltransferase [Pseudomonadota bacterium]
MSEKKQQVHDFWNQASCGEELYLSNTDQRVLEIGVGLGADHQRYAEAGAELYGIDLTDRAVAHTRQRLQAFGLHSNLSVGDAENLDFPDESFDRVYTWGVLHHSPDTAKAVAEVWRVLKRGAEARIMVYNKWSIVGLMLWVRYALLALKPWRSLREIYATYLESPGTKAYSVSEARQLFSRFSEVRIRTVLTHGDLLESRAGQRHQGRLLDLARMIWPRGLIRQFFPKAGLFMLVEARK